MTTRLEAKVQAVNAANEYANELYAVLVKAVRPFVGKKIVKQTGELTEALKKAIPEFPRNGTLNVFNSGYRSYSLDWVVKTSAVVDGVAMYHESWVRIGTIANHVLTGIHDTAPDYRTDFTAKEVGEKRAEYKRLQEIADKAKGEIPAVFGEYDR